MGAIRRTHLDQRQKKRDKWYEDTTASLASMQEQLKALSAAQQNLKVSSYGFAPNTNSTATIGQQQVANANLRVNSDNMAPSARRNMNKAA